MDRHRPPQPPRPASACQLCPCRWRRDEWHWRLADRGYRTCSACADRLGDWLREVRDLYAELDPTPKAGEYGHRSGFGSRSPARDAVIALTDPRAYAATQPDDIPSVVAVLHEWVRRVAADRALQIQHAASVPRDVELLLTNLTWITQQSWVEDFELELGEVRAAVRRGADATEADSPPDGTCPKCTRPLWINPHDQNVQCRCGEIYDRRDWLRLRRQRATA